MSELKVNWARVANKISLGELVYIALLLPYALAMLLLERLRAEYDNMTS